MHMNRMNDMRKSCLFRRNVFIKITQLFSFKIEVDFSDQTELRSSIFRIFTQRLRKKLHELVCQICEGETRQFSLKDQQHSFWITERSKTHPEQVFLEMGIEIDRELVRAY